LRALLALLMTLRGRSGGRVGKTGGVMGAGMNVEDGSGGEVGSDGSGALMNWASSGGMGVMGGKSD
jgi:hypothetical protein